MNHYLGMCLPSSCNSDDVRQLIKLIPFPGSSALERCEVKSEGEVDRTHMAIMCVFIFLFVLVCASTFIDWILHSGKENLKLNRDDKRCVSVTVAFSFCNNTKRLLKNINDDNEGLLLGNCVRGVVVASVAWIILGHTYVFPFKAFYMQASSLEYLRNYLEQYYFSFILSFPLAYDALFVCNGFLLTFPFWYSSSKSQDVSVNVIYLVIKNYIRLCLPLLLCLGITVLLPLIGSGPFWNEILGETVSKCKENAWAHIGMYSNFFSEKEQCLPHLWYVSCLAQLTLIGILFAWILSKSAKFGIFLIVITVAGCNAAVGIITLKNEFPPSYIAYFTENSSSLFWKINLALPLSHFGPYAAGMLTGILIARRIHHKIRFCVGGLGWIVCVGLIYGIVLVTYKYRDDSLSAYWSAVYASNHRTIFALCVAWIMIACSFGTG
ncbi:nose resistant to fluoxetine protein 6-like, partial [Stegodyphus dumicola]|uniref:nose resistant to fluoxetine protein 6-like n=1 Tax=Stegodyphus dumicola TaxID=202533 RepID=UPI0015AD7017